MLRHIVPAITILMLTQVAAPLDFQVRSKITLSETDLEKNSEERRCCLALADQVQTYLKWDSLKEAFNVGVGKITEEGTDYINTYLKNMPGKFQEIVKANPRCPKHRVVDFGYLENFGAQLEELVESYVPPKVTQKISTRGGSSNKQPTLLDSFNKLRDEVLYRVALAAFSGESAAIESLEVAFIQPDDNKAFGYSQAAAVTVLKAAEKKCKIFFNKSIDEVSPGSGFAKKQNQIDIGFKLNNNFVVATNGQAIVPGAPLPDLDFKWSKPKLVEFPGDAVVYSGYSRIQNNFDDTLKKSELIDCSFSTDGVNEHLRLRFNKNVRILV